MYRYQNRNQTKRDRNGKFETNTFEDERLVDRVEFRVSSLDWRRAMHIFQHHRAEFGWEIHSDMFRWLMKRGLTDAEAAAKNPSDDMKRMKRMAEELEVAGKLTARHTQLDASLTRLSDNIQEMMMAGDLGAVRQTLLEFKRTTAAIPDQAIKDRRETEFDIRWGNLWDSLNRPAMLPIDG